MTRMTRRRKLLFGALMAVSLTLLLAVAVLSSNWAARRTGQEIVRILEARFDATAAVEEVRLTLFPRLSITGRGLTFTREREEHRLPFVRIDRFHASGSLIPLLRRSIDLVEIEGFQIDIARGPKPPGESMKVSARDLAIGEIRASNGLLRLLPDDPEKLPLNFQLDTVTFRDFSFERGGR